MKLQSVVLHTNPSRNLYYVGIYNTDTVKQSSSMSSNYSRAKHLHKQMLEGGDARGLKSGFMMSLINTNFEGWESHILIDNISNDEAIEYKKDFIANAPPEEIYVGSDRIFVKGDVKNITGFDSSWTRKWNIGNMTQQKIKDKVIFIVKSIPDNVPQSIYGDAYMCITCPGYMQRKHNFTAFEINDLVTLYKYVRMYLGYDLEELNT